MNFKRYLLYLIIIVFTYSQNLTGQHIDSASCSLVPRLSFYTYEKQGEFLLTLPSYLYGNQLNVSISAGGRNIADWSGAAATGIIRIPFLLELTPGIYKVTAVVVSKARPGFSYLSQTELPVLKYKVNEVKYDRLTGGMIVNRLPFFPFGFYCYSPVPATLPEEEVTHGFNMISPYQTILPETLGERKAYMDRCARLGMKVHYNLLSLCGGGGMNSTITGLGHSERMKRLKEEISTFKDHPALLAWYISDEPNGWNIPPDTLRQIFILVREADPWHPVSMVFMAPFNEARQYSEACDIVMADPYPVPRYPVGMAGDVAGQLRTAFSGKKPLWMAVQSFGGGEIWEREPTAGELRSMTWQSIVKGATGIQYFVRQGSSFFPKAVSAWSECSTMAMEVAELTPWLLSSEAAPAVEPGSSDILTTSRVHKGRLLVIAVNRINDPLPLNLRIRISVSGKARSLFENRILDLHGGVLSDRIAPFGTQAYLIDLDQKSRETTEQVPNLLRDPGFEDLSALGVPSACYARPGGDRGATYFLDTREQHSGDHSLRLFTPEKDKGVIIRMFPCKVHAGATYAISVWAKSDPGQRNFPVTSSEKERLYDVNTDKQYAEIRFGAFGTARFVPDSTWRRYMTFVKIPVDTLSTISTNLVLRMPGEGVAWFDDLKVSELKEY